MHQFIHQIFTEGLLYTRYLEYSLVQDKHVFCPRGTDSPGLGEGRHQKEKNAEFFKYRVLEEAITGSNSTCKALCYAKLSGGSEKIL